MPVFNAVSHCSEKGRCQVTQAAVAAIGELLDPPQPYRVFVVRSRRSQKVLLGGRERDAPEVRRYSVGCLVVDTHAGWSGGYRLVSSVTGCRRRLVGMVGNGGCRVRVVFRFMGGQYPCVPSPKPRADQGPGKAEEQSREKRFGTCSRAVRCCAS